MRELVLLESGRRQSRPTPAAGIVSIGIHGGLAMLAVIATAQSSSGSRDPSSETRVHYAAPAPAPARPVQQRSVPDPPRPQSRFAVPLPGMPQHPTVSPQIPDVIPPLGESLFDPSVIRELGEGLTAGPATSGDPGLASPPSGGAYSRAQVEEPAAFLPDQAGPRYPEPLLHERATGRVRARFVVGAAGRVDGTPEIVFATHSEFASAVLVFLARARYRPARIGGKPVPQLVEQEFAFELKR